MSAATEDVPSEVLLGRVCGAAIDLLDLDGAGVMLVEAETGANRFAFAISEAASDLEKVQEAMRFGPCRDAADRGEPVVAHDAAQMQRWPRFAEVAATFGITGVAAIPLMSRGRCWGVLDLYRSSDRPWQREALDVAQLLADGTTAYLVISADRERARLAQVQLQYVTTHDPLTGLANRLELFDRLDKLIADSMPPGAAVAAVFIHLDTLADVNAEHGHRAGDHVLREVGLRLANTCQSGGFAARLGGETFVVVHPGLALDADADADADSQARERATRAQLALAEPIELETGRVAVLARIGAAVASSLMTAEELVDEADNALFESVTSSAGTVHVRDYAGPGPASRHGMAAGLPRALDDDALAVHYQPIVTASQPHRVLAVEALLRWRDRQGEIIPARSFIDVATREGLMPAFGAWMIDQACAQLSTWRSVLGERAPRQVFVNLSARELNDPGTPAMLAAAVRRHGLDARDLGLEIVEENFVHRGLVHRLRELRERGHQLAIDDFGSGHSSLHRLMDVEVDVVKIDKALVSELARDPRRVEFMAAVVALTRSLDVDVVAEGVETVEQRDHLIDAGVDRLQGYLFGRPGAADQVGELFGADSMVLVRHVLSSSAAIVAPGAIGEVVRGWFDEPSADVLRAIEDLEDAVDTDGPTRRLQKYLGVEISRAT